MLMEIVLIFLSYVWFWHQCLASSGKGSPSQVGFVQGRDCLLLVEQLCIWGMWLL